MPAWRKFQFVILCIAATNVQASQNAGQSAKPASFESARPGPFQELETRLGIWRPVTGRTIVDDKHAKTGKNCLQLTGGKLTRAILELNKNIDSRGVLSFWAERWTRRTPFTFRIEKSTTGDNWQPLYNGDREVKVGRAFLSHIKIPLNDESIRRLRFSVTSPPNTGILLDDFRIAVPQPQRIVGVEVVPLTLPALVGVKASPLLKLKIETVGNLNPISIKSLEASFTGKPEDVESVAIYSSGAAPNPVTLRQLGLPRTIGKEHRPADSLRFAASHKLLEGNNYIWIACEVAKNANRDRRIGAICHRIDFSNAKVIKPGAGPTLQRIGVSVRNGGDDGVNTFRIPGLATSNQGTLIAVYDVRRRSGADLPGDIDVGMSRSTDGGRTWEPMKVIIDMGDDPNWRYDGIGDPAILVDQTTGTIWVSATWSHGNRSWRGSGPGLTPAETGQLMLVRSDDDGKSWSKPINITEQIKRPEWCFILQGPGKGITMRNGTIVFAAQYQDTPENKRLPRSTIIYSEDHGKTWTVGTGAFDDTTEAQVVEVEPGVLMLNCRYNRKSARVVMTTRDMGKTWKKHSTTERSLIEPRACMASLIDVKRELGESTSSLLLFSNPDSLRSRSRITIKASFDQGLTWPKQSRLLLDEGAGRGYSCITMIDKETVGILYEGSQAHMTFQRIALRDLIVQRKVETNPAPKQQSLRLPRVFGSHMVLQAGISNPVWGHSEAGAKILVTFANETYQTTADAEGKWRIQLQKQAATSKPATMIVQSSRQRIELKDIVIGEVWVCAGQSNMEWPLSQSHENSPGNMDGIRLLHLTGPQRGRTLSFKDDQIKRLTPGSFCRGRWQVASTESARRFSAVAWHFGQTLRRELNVPIGLICPAVGGSPTEAWIAKETLRRDATTRKLVSGNWLDNPLLGDFCRTRGEQNLLAAIQAGEQVPMDTNGPNHAFKPGFMWKAGIKPIIPFGIRGAIWYQGESNAETRSRVIQHNTLFPLLIQDWRKRWNQGEFPFLFVQLPALKRPEWPLFREGQRRTLAKSNNVGMAITLDTGHPTNVHPKHKKPVGERLARYALGTTYDSTQHAIFSGPLIRSAKRQVNRMIVTFAHAGAGLKTARGDSLPHFELCGNDGQYYPARALISARNEVTLTSSQVPQPKHARYAYKPFPVPPVNLYNSANIPASPFTTENDDSLFANANRQKPGTLTSKDKRPNILLIVGEDHGCELSCYGDPVIQTPNIDRLATQGVLFENGYVTQSVCSPSRSTIFTGLYPHQNGQLGLATHQYSWFKKWPTTYSILKGAGYRTGLIGKTHILPLDAVEQHVDFRFQKSSNFSKSKVAEYAVKAGEFFRASERPFFMTVNYPDAHWPLQGSVDGLPKQRVDPDKVAVMPYVGHDNHRLRAVARKYYDCMLRLDECVGQLLSELKKSGKADNTLVIFIGDHGAQMARGKVTVYEGGIRVPFIVRWPDHARASVRSKALVSTIDLLPTFLDAAGLKARAGLPGKSLRPVLQGERDREFRRTLACERNCDAARHTFPQRTIRDARFKLIYSPLRDREDPAARYYREHGASHWAGCPTDQELKSASNKTKAGYARWLNPPEYQLYNLIRDPHEWDDLSTKREYAGVLVKLKQSLKDWQRQTDDPIADPNKLRALVAENDKVTQAGRRSPREGWQYLRYLAPIDASASIQ